MRGVYTVSFSDLTLATNSGPGQTLVFISVGTNCSLEILRAWASQGGSASSLQHQVQLETQVSVFPTLTSAAPVATSPIDQASKITGGTAGAAGTSGINATVEGAGTKTTRVADSFNNLNGWIYIPVPEERIVLSASGAMGLGLWLPAIPSETANWSAGITFREW